MKVTVEDQSSVKKVLHIEVPEEKVVSELNKAYSEIKKTAKIKGFRLVKPPDPFSSACIARMCRPMCRPN